VLAKALGCLLGFAFIVSRRLSDQCLPLDSTLLSLVPLRQVLNTTNWFHSRLCEQWFASQRYAQSLSLPYLCIMPVCCCPRSPEALQKVSCKAYFTLSDICHAFNAFAEWNAAATNRAIVGVKIKHSLRFTEHSWYVEADAGMLVRERERATDRSPHQEIHRAVARRRGR